MWIALITPLLIAMGGFAVLLAAAIVFAETGLLAGFFLPGDGLLFTMGVLCASGLVPVPIAVVLLVLWAAAVVGDVVGYLIGRRLGAALFSRPRSRLFDPEHLRKAERFVAKHGDGAVVLARFLPWGRTFVPVVAGAASMPRASFLRANLLGATAWVGGVTMAGYSLGQVPWVADHVKLATALLGVATLLPVLITKLLKRALRRGRGVPVPMPADEVAAPVLVGVA